MWAWSYVLTAVGVFGLYLSGKKLQVGWLVGLMAQILWVYYAVATRQWGFIVSAFAYGTIYARNFLLWGDKKVKKEVKKDERVPPAS